MSTNININSNTTLHLTSTSNDYSLSVNGNVYINQHLVAGTLSIQLPPSENDPSVNEPLNLIGINDTDQLSAISYSPAPIPPIGPPGGNTQIEYTGAIIIWPSSTPPFGSFLKCNGQSVSRITYSKLFALMGVTYGSGDTASQFNLPDYRGMFIRAMDDGANIDPDSINRTGRPDFVSGDAVGTIQQHATALPQNLPFVTSVDGDHFHTIPDGIGSIDNTVGSYYTGLTHTYSEIHQLDPAGSHSHGINSGGDIESRPRNVYVQYWIAYE